VKQLTEAQAWREIARRLGQGKRFRRGLCYEAHLLFWRERRCSVEMSDIMEKRAANHISSEGFYGFAYRPGEERDARILAALWMALEAEEGLEP